MRPWLLLPAAVLVLGTGLVPAVARADPASDAKDLFARGRDMRARGDCAGAAGLFRRAWETFPEGLGSLRNLAECEEQLGHFASSRRAWLDLKRGLITTSDHKYDGWSQDADQAAARLAPKLATVTIDLNLVGPDGAATTGGKGVDVTMDGEPLATVLIGTPLERDPGRHVVRVGGARVHDPQQKALDLAAGDTKRVAMRVVVTPDKSDPNDAAVPAAGGAQGGSEPPIEDGGASARATRRMIGWIAIGAGGASLVGAGISLGVRQAALNDVNGTCHNGMCPNGWQSTVSRGDLAATLVNVLGAVGILGVAGGIVLLSTSADPATAHAGLVVTPTLGGASATLRW
jgi:hypothetical protein